ncbi:hypothetical protein [Gordonia zhaorongruii]|uniref:hypothetical protein n=1 Tax=Gordonia zhaorongruii TaxID=2597659 RepID=UPI00104E0146|nr:hypothetical protein [Gordonia zhaorongruii]
MDPVIEYGFGTGDDELSTWRSPADLDLDGDGVLDAVALDFDGDDRTDDAMWDSDGDGAADRSVLDLDDDGVRESGFVDDGSGLWARVAGAPTDSDRGEPAPTTPHESVLDTDGDGTADTVLADTDGDGYADTHRPVPRP